MNLWMQLNECMNVVKWLLSFLPLHNYHRYLSITNPYPPSHHQRGMTIRACRRYWFSHPLPLFKSPPLVSVSAALLVATIRSGPSQGCMWEWRRVVVLRHCSLIPYMTVVGRLIVPLTSSSHSALLQGCRCVRTRHLWACQRRRPCRRALQWRWRWQRWQRWGREPWGSWEHL